MSAATDRELLELAAKAAGVAGDYFEDAGGDYGINVGGARLKLWNPLEWDGDTLRLAVKLRMSFSSQRNMVTANLDDFSVIGFTVHRRIDPVIAMRRAIVSVAADIGKAMR